MRVAVSVLLAILMTGTPATGFAQTRPEDKAEAERKRREDRDAERATREAKDALEIMREAEDEFQELALASLEHIYPDRFLQDYVNELGQSMVPKEVPPGVLFSFRVIDEPLPNAFALPDGRIFIHSGLLAFVSNEAQLAMILGHEIGHVIERHYIDSVKQARRTAIVNAIVGGAAGALLGMFGGKKGIIAGVAGGVVAGIVVAEFRMNNYSRKQEDEADLVGTRLALDRNFDAKESLAFFEQLSNTFGEQDKFRNLLWGRHSRNKERIQHIKSSLESGDLLERYNKARVAGDLVVGSGNLPLFVSRMKRDTAIRLMDEYDRYGNAKTLLEDIEPHRPRDPRTLWALGRVYKLIGRTPADRSKALDYLQRAVRADERNMFAVAYRDLGLMQARMEQTAAASESLKTYVSMSASLGAYPKDLEEIYDYLLTFGDGTWTAPPLETGMVRTAYTPVPVAPPAPPPSPSSAMPAPSDAKRAATPTPSPATRPAGRPPGRKP